MITRSQQIRLTHPSLKTKGLRRRHTPPPTESESPPILPIQTSPLIEFFLLRHDGTQTHVQLDAVSANFSQEDKAPYKPTCFVSLQNIQRNSFFILEGSQQHTFLHLSQTSFIQLPSHLFIHPFTREPLTSKNFFRATKVNPHTYHLTPYNKTQIQKIIALTKAILPTLVGTGILCCSAGTCVATKYLTQNPGLSCITGLITLGKASSSLKSGGIIISSGLGAAAGSITGSLLLTYGLASSPTLIPILIIIGILLAPLLLTREPIINYLPKDLQSSLNNFNDQSEKLGKQLYFKLKEKMD